MLDTKYRNISVSTKGEKQAGAIRAQSLRCAETIS